MPTRRYSAHRHRTELLERIDSDIPYAVAQDLGEDLGGIVNTERDLTAQLLPVYKQADATIITREAGVFCGQGWLNEVFIQRSNQVKVTWQVSEALLNKSNILPGRGSDHSPSVNIATFRGPA
ncbi:MAG: nicotinate-nucleotide diphosphorylase, partial [Serratia symbiotica]|nr:nicotinate-nucleotide diphosphorylase [Serratia symbiotica]